MLSPGHPTPGLPNFLRPPIASTIGAGILTRFPSATAFALTLGADSPSADERGGGNLGLSASEPFTRFIATHVSIRTSDTSSMPLDTPSPAYGTLSYHVATDSSPRPLTRSGHLLTQVPSLLIKLQSTCSIRSRTRHDGRLDFMETLWPRPRLSPLNFALAKLASSTLA
jgi:hypothetical protein